MSDDTYADAGSSGKLTRAFRRMPKWKVGLLVTSLIVGVIGVGGKVAAHNLRKPQTVTTVQQVPAPAQAPAGVPGGGSGFMGGDPTAQPPADQTVTTTTTVTPPASTATDTATSLATRIGFSFFVGIIAGVISRTFLKIAALLAGLIVAAIAAAHYFNINLDLSGVQTQAGQATTWVQGQLGQLWGVVREHLPSAGAGTAGFLFGMKRR